MNEYTKVLSATEKAQSSYRQTITLKELNKSYTFEHFRSIAAALYQDVETDKAGLEKEIAELRKTYSQSKAIELISISKKGFQDRTEVTRDILRQKLNEIVSAKRDQLKSFTLAAPDTETMTLLQAVKMRNEPISDAELNLLINATAGNFQAMSIVHSIAEENGYSFRMPFNPGTFSALLEEVNGTLEKAVSELGNDGMSVHSAELYKGSPERSGYLTDRFIQLDYDPATAVMKPQLTLKAQMEQFRDAAEKNGAYKDRMKAEQFLEEHGAEITTDEERKAELESKANEIMKSSAENV